MNRAIKFDSAANLYAVIGTDDYVLECFETEKQAADYLAEFEEKMPKTAGEVSDLAKKHGALFRSR